MSTNPNLQFEIFGSPVTLPNFPHPESFRRNVVSGFIPSPTLLTESVPRSDLVWGDLVLYLDRITIVYRSDDGMWLELRAYNNEEVCYLRGPRTDAPLDRIREITFGSLDSGIPIEWIRDDRYSGMGKFQSQYAEYCWQTALDMGSSDTAGDCSEIGWHASRVDIKYRGPYRDMSGNPVEYGRDSVLFQWSEEIGTPAGYIVCEDDRGAVDVEFFETLSELDARWEAIQTAESAWYDEQESEDSETEADDDSGCRVHGIIDCTSPECDPAGVFHSEHVQNEIWGGTE